MAQATADAETPAWGLRGLAQQANPAFAAAVVAVPILALVGAVTQQAPEYLLYVHVMAGILWTGIDLFMGTVLGPVLGRMDVERRAGFFSAFTPKMTFLMPTLAMVTIAGGVLMAFRIETFQHAEFWLALMTAGTLLPVVGLIGYQFSAFRDPRWLGAAAVVAVVSVGGLALTIGDAGMTNHWIGAAIVIVTLLSVIGFGVILPGEARIYRQLTSGEPDTDLIADIGMRNAKLGGLQGLLQLSIIFVMVNIRLY